MEHHHTWHKGLKIILKKYCYSLKRKLVKPYLLSSLNQQLKRKKTFNAVKGKQC